VGRPEIVNTKGAGASLLHCRSTAVALSILARRPVSAYALKASHAPRSERPLLQQGAAGGARRAALNTHTGSKAFPAPSPLKVLPGTEAAQAAYPYYMQFTAADDQRFWFYNSMHFPEPMSAFDMVTAEAAYCALGSSTTRVHCIPTTLGIDYRIINGRV